MLSDTRAGEQPSRAGSAREENRICYSCGVRKIHSSAWRLAILSAVLQVLIFPLPNLYVLSWFAVAPLLVAVLRGRAPDTLQLRGEMKLLPARPWQGFVLGYLCGILWYAGNC